MQVLPKHIQEQFFILELNKAHRIFSSRKCSCKSEFERLIKGGKDFSKNNDNISDYNLTDSWLTNLTDIYILKLPNFNRILIKFIIKVQNCN